MRSKKNVLIFLGILVGLNILAWSVVFDLNKSFLEVIFFDIGQGDAIFIKTHQGHQILIDGGPGSKILEKLAQEMPFWDRTIDLIILTHPEKDHLGGLIHVLKNYKVDNILWTGMLRPTNEYREWLDLIEKKESNVFIAKSGQKITTSDFIMEILSPVENLEGKEIKNSNDTSIVSRLVFNKKSFLFTGDITKLVEQQIIDRGIDISANVLKVGHHGSKTSSIPKFIGLVLPEIAVIQCGRNNPYGHPHIETLKILEEYDINVLRTDLDGDIKIFSDGKNIKIIK